MRLVTVLQSWLNERWRYARIRAIGESDPTTGLEAIGRELAGADASAALWSKDLVAGHTWMNPVDDLVFAMALAEFDIEFQLSGNFQAIVLDILERIVTIDVRLALSQRRMLT